MLSQPLPPTDAMTAYADCSCDGIGVPMSIIDAKFWYEKAADAGGMVAQYNLGLVLSSGGPGVPADPVGAARLFRKGADQGHDNAQCNLGHCFATGKGVQKNTDRALYWFGKAISQEHVRAMHNYAVLLLHIADETYGTDAEVGKSPLPQVLYWFRRAAAGGNEKAASAVADLVQQVSQNCAKCGIAKDSCEKLLKCKKCTAVYYCGRLCQGEHWQMGHKTDCCWKKHMVDHGSMQSDSEPRDVTVSKTEGKDVVTTTAAQDVAT